MPKVLHLGWSFSNHVTRWVYGLKERGWECGLLSYDGEPLPSIETYIIQRKRFGKLGYLQAIPEMRKVVGAFKPDIIHAHYAAGFGLWGAFSGIRPLVISCWGTDVVTTARAPVGGALARWALAQADKTLVTSQFLKRVVEDLPVTLKTAPSVIPFGIDIDSLQGKTFFRRSADEVAGAKADKRIRLLFFKHHRAIYGPCELLRAFASIAGQFENATLTMAGSGSLTDELRQLTKTLGLERRVSFPGFIDHQRALSYIAGHDIMIMPSQVEEGFGVAALEALAVGVPVVAANSGGVSEIVDDNQSGFLVNPANLDELADAMAKLIADKQMRQRFGEHGRRRVAERYNWKDNLDEMEAIYNGLLSARDSSATDLKAGS
jgi:L-malate glycosyltransferase